MLSDFKATLRVCGAAGSVCFLQIRNWGSVRLCDQIKVTQLRHNKAGVGPRTSDGECVTWTTLHFAHPHVTIGYSELILTGPQISLFSANISMFKLKPKYSLPFFFIWCDKARVDQIQPATCFCKESVTGTCLFIYKLAAFMPPWQNWGIGTDILSLVKLNIVWPFILKVCLLLC